MATDYDTTHTADGWFVIHRRDEGGQWVATDTPVEVRR